MTWNPDKARQQRIDLLVVQLKLMGEEGLVSQIERSRDRLALELEFWLVLGEQRVDARCKS